MLGIVIGALAGVILSFADAGKKALTGFFSPEAIIVITMVFGITINLIYLSIVGFPEVSWPDVWLPVLVFGALAAIGEGLFMYGLRSGDLSLVTPLLAFVPVVAGVFDYVLFSQLPTGLGALGVVVIVLGAYLLSIKRPLSSNLFRPFLQLLEEKGCRLVLLSVLIGGALFVGQRFGTQHSSPVLFVTLTLVVDCLVFLLLGLRLGFRIPHTRFDRNAFMMTVGTGLSWGVGITLMYLSYHYTLGAYASSAQQVQIPCAIVLGALLFKEESFKQRIAAGLIMCVGVVLVSLSEM